MDAACCKTGAVLWLTGLSGSGKSTIAREVERRLLRMEVPAFMLDGDEFRASMSRDLGFDAAGRKENIRRASVVAAALAKSGIVVISSFISPFAADRANARVLAPKGCFFEIHIDAPLEICAKRDPKGLYKKALAGEMPEFTGISAPYEPPLKPELRINTAEHSVDEAVESVIRLISPP